VPFHSQEIDLLLTEVDMATTVLLVRHAQTNSNLSGFYMGWSNEDLNDVGYKQARRLSSRLASLPIASVYSSPLRRVFATSEIICEPLNLEPIVLDELIEIQLGDWQGLLMDEIKRRWPELWQQWRNDPSGMTIPNGESLEGVTERAILALQRMVAANRDQHIIIVTHDVIVKVSVAHILGVSNSIYRKFEIGNASLSVIRISDTRSRLVMLNDTSHL
jgi:probable phosphoglycerate mutase